MARDKRPLLAGIRNELDGLSSELAEMVRSHWELARLEITADVRQLRRLAVAMAVAAVMALVALPLLAVALAWWIEGSLGLGFGGWLAVLGVGLLTVAAAIAYFAWRRFRGRFCGLEETLEEIREDLAWLGEWTGRENSPEGDETPSTDP